MYLQHDVCYHLIELFAYAFPDDHEHIANMYDYVNDNDLKGFDRYVGHLSSTQRHFIVEAYELVTNKRYVENFKTDWNKYKKCPALGFRIAIFPALIISYIEAIIASSNLDYLLAISLFMFSAITFYRWMNNYSYLRGRDLLINGDIVRYIPLQ